MLSHGRTQVSPYIFNSQFLIFNFHMPQKKPEAVSLGFFVLYLSTFQRHRQRLRP